MSWKCTPRTIDVVKYTPGTVDVVKCTPGTVDDVEVYSGDNWCRDSVPRGLLMS